MGRRFATLLCALTFAALRCAGQGIAASSAEPALEPGIVLPHQVCASKPEQSYALYLPSQYTSSKQWSIVYAFDPAARGKIPVELMKDAAERYGYIIAGSNNSQNGSWKLELEAAQAMLEDTHRRLSIDDRRLYFGGFSGGARVASLIAQRCRCSAGVILNGAGFPTPSPPSREAVFAVFAAVGSLDFNYPEVTELDAKLAQAGFPHLLRHFDGEHDWAPASVMEEALAWLRVIAMKQQHEPRDEHLLTAQRDAAFARARGMEQAGEIYEAWREYQQQAATFEGVTDASQLQNRANALAKGKPVREGARREKGEFDDQRRLTSEIFAGLAALRENSGDRADTKAQMEQRIIALRDRAKTEKRPQEQQVFHRALSGTLVEAMEAGEECLRVKDLTAAKDYFDLAIEADPDSSWAFRDAAKTRSLLGDRKGTLDTLRHAREKSKDLVAFLAWLKEESAFDQLRDDPQFRALLSNP